MRRRSAAAAAESVKLEERRRGRGDRGERLTQIGGNYTRPTRLYNIQELRQVLKSCRNFTPATFMHIQKSGEGRKRPRLLRQTGVHAVDTRTYVIDAEISVICCPSVGVIPCHVSALRNALCMSPSRGCASRHRGCNSTAYVFKLIPACMLLGTDNKISSGTSGVSPLSFYFEIINPRVDIIIRALSIKIKININIICLTNHLIKLF